VEDSREAMLVDSRVATEDVHSGTSRATAAGSPATSAVNALAQARADLLADSADLLADLADSAELVENATTVVRLAISRASAPNGMLDPSATSVASSVTSVAYAPPLLPWKVKLTHLA